MKEINISLFKETFANLTDSFRLQDSNTRLVKVNFVCINPELTTNNIWRIICRFSNDDIMWYESYKFDIARGVFLDIVNFTYLNFDNLKSLGFKYM